MTDDYPFYKPIESLCNTSIQNQSEYLITLTYVNKNEINENFVFKVLAINFNEAINKVEKIIDETDLKNFKFLSINKDERTTDNVRK